MAKKGLQRRIRMERQAIVEVAAQAAEKLSAHRQRFEDVRTNLMVCLAALNAAAGCSNGKETQRMIEIAKDTLMTHVSQWHTVIQQLERAGIVMEKGITDEVTAHCKTYYDAATAFIVEPTAQRQRDLRATLEDANPRLKPMFDEISRLTKLGRNPAERALLGRLALKFDPAERQRWKAGEQIYQQLVSTDEKILSEDQRLLKTWLAGYMLPGTNTIAPDQRTALGKIIGQEMKKARALVK